MFQYKIQTKTDFFKYNMNRPVIENLYLYCFQLYTVEECLLNIWDMTVAAYNFIFCHPNTAAYVSYTRVWRHTHTHYSSSYLINAFLCFILGVSTATAQECQHIRRVSNWEQWCLFLRTSKRKQFRLAINWNSLICEIKGCI